MEDLCPWDTRNNSIIDASILKYTEVKHKTLKKLKVCVRSKKESQLNGRREVTPIVCKFPSVFRLNKKSVLEISKKRIRKLRRPLRLENNYLDHSSLHLSSSAITLYNKRRFPTMKKISNIFT